MRIIHFLVFTLQNALELDLTNCISCRAAFRDDHVQTILSSGIPEELYCPPNCANPILVEGTDYYSYRTTVCSAAAHAGAIKRDIGGYFYVEKIASYFANKTELTGTNQNGVISKSIKLEDLSPLFEGQYNYEYDMVYHIGTPKQQVSSYPRYQLNNTESNFNGDYVPDDCSSGRYRLTQVSGGSFIKFKIGYGWTLYKYSTDLSGCDERNVNSCPRTYGMFESSTVNPPSEIGWHFTTDGLPDTANLTDLQLLPVSSTIILSSVTPYITLKEPIAPIVPIENTTTSTMATSTTVVTNTTLLPNCDSGESTRFFETFSFGFGSGVGLFLLIGLGWLLYTNLCRRKPPTVYKAVDIDDTNSTPDFLRNI